MVLTGHSRTLLVVALLALVPAVRAEAQQRRDPRRVPKPPDRVQERPRSLTEPRRVEEPRLIEEPRRAEEPRRIEDDIVTEVTRYPRYTVFDDVELLVDDGTVTLSGKVTMPYKKSEIERRVARVPGVARIDNQLEVLPVSEFDEDLRHRIARAIYGNPSFWQYAAMSNPPIHIIVHNGRVTLKGVVQTEVEKQLARALATSFSSFTLVNELKTEAEVRAERERPPR